MQSAGGQFGLTDMQQFMLGRTAPHMFAAPHSHQDTNSLQHHLHPNLHPQQHQHQQQVELLQLYQHQALQDEQHNIEQHTLNHFHQQQAASQQQQQQQQGALFSLHHQKHALDPSLHMPFQQHMNLDLESPEMASPLAIRAPPAQFKSLFGAARESSMGEDDNELAAEDGERGVGGSRWPREETLALLRIRSEMDSMFREAGLKGPLWEEVSRKLSDIGYHRSAKKCKEKFENVHKYYKKTKDGRSGRQEGKTYRFCSELEAIYAASNEEEGTASGDVNGCGGAQVTSEGDPNILRGGGGAQKLAPFLPGGGGLTVETGTSAASLEGLAALKRARASCMDPNASWTSSGENYDEPYTEQDAHALEEDEEEQVGKKRKRKSWRFMKGFFENLTKRLMEQQDALHRKFLETVERRDKERMAREEAHKRQEMARLNREHELRAQEHALAATRDAALVAFLQKVTGETLLLPQQPLMQVPVSNPAAAAQKPQPPPPPPPPTAPSAAGANVSTPNNSTDNLTAQMQMASHSDDSLYLAEKDGSDANCNTRRWPKVEVLALIRLRTGLEPRFQEAGPKAQLWEEISVSMACMGFSRSAKRCKEKWENINKYFRKAKDSSRKRLDNPKTCPYFHQLEALYEKGVLSSPGTPSSISKLSGAPRLGNEGHNCSSEITSNMATDHNNVNPSIDHSNIVCAAACSSKEDSQQQQMVSQYGCSSSNGVVHEANMAMMSMTESRAAACTRSNNATMTQLCISQVENMTNHQHHHHHHICAAADQDSKPFSGAEPTLAFGGAHFHAAPAAVSKGSNMVPVEGFVREMLELQQQQHLKMVDEFERLEQAREQQARQHQQEQSEDGQQAQERAPQACTLSSQDSATLMALVHKLAGHPSSSHLQFSLSTPPATGTDIDENDEEEDDDDDEDEDEDPRLEEVNVDNSKP